MYTGPEPCAEAGRTTSSRLTTDASMTKRLNIVKLYLIPNTEVVKAMWMDLERVSGGPRREVSRMPASGDHFVDHAQVRVDPDDSQVERHEEHVDRGVETGVPADLEQEAVADIKVRAEHEPPEPANE